MSRDTTSCDTMIVCLISIPMQDNTTSNEIQAFTAAELAALPKGSLPENVRDIGLFILRDGLSHWETVDTSTFAS